MCVIGFFSNRIAVVNVSDPSTPAVVGSVIRANIKMAGAFGMAVLLDNKYARVIGQTESVL